MEEYRVESVNNRDPLNQVWTFSVKDKIVNMLGFAGHKVFVAATQLCLHGRKAVIANTQNRGHGVCQHSLTYNSRVGSSGPQTITGQPPIRSSLSQK